MPGRIALWLIMMLGLASALAVPATAQALIPHAYEELPEGETITPARRDKPAERIAAEQAAADSAEAACNTGDLAGCTALGRAFMRSHSAAARSGLGRVVQAICFQRVCTCGGAMPKDSPADTAQVSLMPWQSCRAFHGEGCARGELRQRSAFHAFRTSASASPKVWLAAMP